MEPTHALSDAGSQTARLSVDSAYCGIHVGQEQSGQLQSALVHIGPGHRR
ncbi:hypothetical protein ACIBJC_07950 [Streptomyces sp. NPDC050509]